MEPGEGGANRRKWSRPRQGTPQGGVISPLLANLYLHWFDKLFHRADGPAQWAKARLVRYADDFVVLARYQGPRLTGWIEVEAGRLAGVGDQSGEDARGGSEGREERVWTFWDSRSATTRPVRARVADT